MGRRAVLLTVAVLIAAAGAALVLLYVQGINARAVSQQQPVEVLTATAQIESGETIADAQAAGKLDLVEWPQAKVLEGALGNAEALQGQVALTTVFAGEQIVPTKFGQPGSQDSSLGIPKGKMAVSVQLSDTSRVAGFISPGAHVAVFFSTIETGSSAPQDTGGSGITQLLVPDVEVIGVGHTTVLSTTTTTPEGTETVEEIPKTILTLAVDQEDAEKVIFSARSGELSFALLNDESKTEKNRGTVISDVLAESLGAAQ